MGGDLPAITEGVDFRTILLVLLAPVVLNSAATNGFARQGGTESQPLNAY
jgi:hypothetical protein